MVVEARTDDGMRRDIIDQLSWDARIDAADIDVAVSQGQVALSGTVPHYTARRIAEEDIRAIPDVQSIRNSLAVKHPRAGELPTDQELKGRIQSILQWQPDIDPAGIDVAVQGGWVTLRGRVDACWRRSRVERLVFSVYGIIGLDNQLAVRPLGESMDDEEIQRQVRAALQRNVRVHAEQIGVAVRGGVVTVTGTAPTLWACWQVQEAIENVAAGICAIENDMIPG